MKAPLIYSTRKYYPKTHNGTIRMWVDPAYSEPYSWFFSDGVTSSTSADYVQFTYDAENKTSLTVSISGEGNAWSDDYIITYESSTISLTSTSPQAIYDVMAVTNSLDSCYVGINEIALADNFNNAIINLNDNLLYLVDKTEFITNTPSVMTHRYGNISATAPVSGIQWTQINENYVDQNYYWDYTSDALDVDKITATTSSIFYTTSGSNIINIVPLNDGNTPIPSTKSYPLFTNQPFGNIIDIKAEENGNFWVLEESGLITKLIYDSLNKTWDYKEEWDDLIREPFKMILQDQLMYVANKNSDGNKIISIFDEYMNDLGSINNEYTNMMTSICTTKSYIILITDENKLTVLNKLGSDIGEYIKDIDLQYIIRNYTVGTGELETGASILDAYSSADSMFFYAKTENLIYKFTEDGGCVGFGGTTPMPIAYEQNPEVPYVIRDITDNENNQLIVGSNFDIIKYYDSPQYSYQTAYNTQELKDKMWPESKLMVSKYEYCAYYIYDRCFHRLYDNIKLLHTALLGKLKTNSIISYIEPFYFGEVKDLPYTKDDLFIGINEIHTEGAVNRNIRKLYKCIETIQDMMNNKVLDPLLTNDVSVFWNGQFIFDGHILYGGTTTGTSSGMASTTSDITLMTIFVKDSTSSSPINGAVVKVYTELGGVLVSIKTTDSNGYCYLRGLTGNQFYAVVTKDGYADGGQIVYNATTNIIPIISTGVIGGEYALVFNSTDGLGSHVNIGALGFANTTPYTVEIEFTMDTFQDLATLIYKGRDHGLLRLIGSVENPRLGYTSGHTIGYDLNDGKVKVVVAKSSGYRVSTYVNGSLSGNFSAFFLGGGSEMWHIGTDDLFGEGTTPLLGKVPYVAIYDYEKDSATVLAEASRVPLPSDSGIIAHQFAVPAGRTAQGASTAAPSNCMYDSVSDTYFENEGTGTFGIEAL